MLIGQYTHNIDRKGRLIMPAKFRTILKDEVYITRGLDGCLCVYTLEEWNNLYQYYSSLPVTNESTRKFVRIFMSNACEVEPDAQGRILIPSHLIQSAGLVKECLIVGVGNRVEIWSKERWTSMEDEAQDSYEAAANNIPQPPSPKPARSSDE